LSSAISYGARCSELAEQMPARAALIFVPNEGQPITVSRSLLDQRSNQMARLLLEHGVGEKSLVVPALPTCVEHYYASLGAWKVGACVLPLNDRLPAQERNGLLELASKWRPVWVLGEWDVGDINHIGRDVLKNLDGYDDSPLDDVVPCPGRAIGSGGSTGKPKIIVDPKPFSHIPGCWGPLNHIGMTPEQTLLLTGRLYHSMGFELSHLGLFEGHTVVVPEQFEAARAVELIEHYQVNFMALIPIMMQRIAKLDGIENRDFSSIESFYHAGGACAGWLKRRWLKLVDPTKQWELYGSTEAKGQTLIRGDEWLARPGSVGRPFASEMKIVDEQGKEVAKGEIGEIHMRNMPPPNTAPGGIWPQEPTCEYIGAPQAKTTEDGFTSVGDMGYIDEDGFVYLADRRVDMIKSGGSNIFPAEIEAVLSEHEQVSDVVVIGVPDDEWGLRVHALIEPVAGTVELGVEVLNQFCRDRLVYYKAPKSYEFVSEMPRDATGKIRRIALREARKSGWIEGMVAVPSGKNK